LNAVDVKMIHVELLSHQEAVQMHVYNYVVRDMLAEAGHAVNVIA